MASAKIFINKKTFKMKIEMVGYEGVACIKDIDELQKLLDAITLREDLKPEYAILTGGIDATTKNRQ